MMDYNSYYPVHTGQPPPPNIMNSQHECAILGPMISSTGQAMHHSQVPSITQGMRHGPASHHMPQQQYHHQQQVMSHPSNHHHHHQQQPNPQQPSPHHGYHQLPTHPPISHSASPHPTPTPHTQQQQQQPPPRPSTGPSPLHHLSPMSLNGPSTKLQQHGMISSQSQAMSQMPQNMSSGMLHVSVQSGTMHHASQPMQQSHNHNYSSNLMVHQNQVYGQGSVNHSHIPHLSPPVSNSRPRSGGSVVAQPSPSNYASPKPVQQLNQERRSPYGQNIPQTELRIIDLNRRLQARPRNMGLVSPLPLAGSSDETIWWENFASEFFADDSSITLRIPGDDEPTEYKIGRTLIPRFFRSYFNGGVTDLSIKLNSNREWSSGTGRISLESEQADIMTKNIIKNLGPNNYTNVVVHTEGNLMLDFLVHSSNNLVIKSWKFNANQCHEYIDRFSLNASNASSLFLEPVTRFGLTKSTFNYLKMCMIMEPMQDLMAQHRQTQLDPRACLKQFLFDRYNIKNIDDHRTQPVKRRKRKAPGTSETNAVGKKSKTNSILTNGLDNSTSDMTSSVPQLPQEVLVVAIVEPSILGANFGDENERRITQLENDQYDSNQNYPCQTSTSCGNQTSTEDLNIKENTPQISNVTKSIQGQTQMVNDIDTIEERDQHHSPKNKADDGSKEPINDQTNCVHDQKTNLILDCKNTILNVDETDANNSSQKSSQSSNAETNTVHKADVEVGTEEETSRPPSANNKSIAQLNGSSNKQNRRRSSERKETLREGLMRTSDFVVAMKDIKSEHPSLWRITTGNNLLQQFEPKSQKGSVVYENTNQYAGWNHEIRKDYVGVDVRLTQHTRNQITVERLLLNFQNIEDAERFHDKHFLIYLQILISTALDPKFWESMEKEPQHHDYFLTSRKIVEDIIKRYKFKLSSTLKLSEAVIKNFEKYPNLIIKSTEKGTISQFCRACNKNPSTQIVTFGNRSYDLHSYKPVKITTEPTKVDDKEQNNYLCDPCLDIVKLYSEVHHMGWKFFNIAKEKAEQHRVKGKTVKAILDDCLNDEEWINMNYAERDSLWSRIDQAL